MAVALAFLKRDFFQNISYRVSFFLQFFGIFFSVAAFYFVGQFFGPAVAPKLESYGGDYFAFVLIGLAFGSYMSIALSGFAQSIREGQMMGTLEIMLLSPTRLSTILLSSSLWDYLFTTFRVMVYLGFGLLFGVNLTGANIPAALAVLLLSTVSFSALGILAAAFVLVLKKGDPVTWLFGGLSGLMAGTYYPISALPDWLQPFSRLFPLTYSLEGMRLAMLRGYSVLEVGWDLLALLGFAVFFLPLSLLIFNQALRRAKKEGSLAQY